LSRVITPAFIRLFQNCTIGNRLHLSFPKKLLVSKFCDIFFIC
uniref:Uncharacterized protein n=1 Tax=Parascaris equorum TaxID=6256 RepID=A0A914RYC1_PAREQ